MSLVDTALDPYMIPPLINIVKQYLSGDKEYWRRKFKRVLIHLPKQWRMDMRTAVAPLIRDRWKRIGICVKCNHLIVCLLDPYISIRPIGMFSCHYCAGLEGTKECDLLPFAIENKD